LGVSGVLQVRLRGLPPLAAARRAVACRAVACLAVACLAAGCTAGGGGHTPRPSATGARHVTHQPSRPPRSSPGQAAPASSLPASSVPASSVPASSVPAIGGGPARLAGQLTTAETVLAAGAAAPAALARQALIVQLACLRLAAHPGWGTAVTARVAPAERAAAAADIAATADLVALTPPGAQLPPWRIVPAQSPAVLRADYRAAQAATGVGWSYLAAINFVETDFGRIAGPSSAGAQGPMQFMPATWASYGHGDIHRPRNAILAAARLLAARGGARDIGSALYAYNPSWRYVDAVRRYASRLRHDPRALMAYYRHQVIYRLGSGWVLLPSGYGAIPAVHAIPLHL
jgi:Transglycosylase SLT domain